MGPNTFKTTNKFRMDCCMSDHIYAFNDDKIPFVVYARKTLNDKAFQKSWASKIVCYTCHTSRRSGVLISARKDPADRC